MKSLTLAFEANHLCPFSTHSSASRSQRVVMPVGSEPLLCGSVSAKLLRTRPASNGSSQRLRCASLAPAASSSALPESGA